ncbi:MAG: heavy metal-binding domain-containing protein [Bacillota bacterium]
MRNQKKSSLLIAIVIFLSVIISACADNKNENKAINNQQQQIPSIVAADTTVKDAAGAVSSASIVRQGVIDLKAIDENNDGKVFECPMDYNVISDKAAACPECKMDLEEVTLGKARENLRANNFQVK